MTDRIWLSRLRNVRWRRLAIAVFAVPAILIGLFAMHVLTAGGMSDSGTAPAILTHAAGAAVVHGQGMDMTSLGQSGTPAPAEECGGVCGPSHDLLGMLCMFALLVTMVLLNLRLIPIRWEELRRVVMALVAKAAALTPPAPPSLHLLSVSRT